MFADHPAHRRGSAPRGVRLGLAFAVASAMVLSGTAASAMGYLPAPPSLTASPVPTNPFGGPASLYLGFMPPGSNCTVTSPSHPYGLPGDGQGQMNLSGTSSGSCSVGDWDEVLSASSFGNSVAGVYRVEVSLATSASPDGYPLHSRITGFIDLPVTARLLTLILRIDVGAVFPAGGLSINLAFSGPVPT